MTPAMAARKLPHVSADMESSRAPDSGQARLEALGYKQQLRRSFGFRSSFGASLTLMSCIMGITASVTYTYHDGGPLAAVWGWVAASLANLLMATAIAELVSAYPVAGGSYVWCLELTDNKPEWTLLAWVTGWLNIVGQFAMTAVNAYFTSKLITTIWLLAGGRHSTNFDVFLIYSICLLLSGVVASSPTDALRVFATYSGAFLVTAGALVIVVLPMLAPSLQPASFVFLGAPKTQFDSVSISTYMFLMALPKVNFAYITPQTPTFLAEETRHAAKVAPQAIIWSVVTSAFLGSCFLLCVLFCIQDPSTLLTGEANGYLVAQVFYDVFKGRFGNPVGGIICLGLLLLMALNATVISMAINARALWAFSRDGGLPLHKVWAAVNGSTGTPVNAVWAMTAAAFLLGLPILAFPDTLACNAVGIACVGLNISYGIPMLLRIIHPGNFEPGPFNLARLQPYLNVLALALMVVISVAFVMPLHIPINGNNLNWAIIPVALTALLAFLLWHGPKPGAAADYRGSARLRDRRLMRACTCTGVPSAAVTPRPVTEITARNAPRPVTQIMAGNVPRGVTSAPPPNLRQEIMYRVP